MKVIIADVISLNGKITGGDDPDIHSWSSTEDWEFFTTLRDSCDVIVIDRHTYETVMPEPEPGRLRVVLTSKPDAFVDANVPGQLEFCNLQSADLFTRIEKSGHNKMMVAGGGRVCADFFRAGLVDEFYLTLEPYLFGSGKSMLAEVDLEVSLQLLEVKKLNDKGTLLVHYAVQKTGASDLKFID